ncbi:MAG: hypothetical protein RBS07_14030 [Lentimicrobium sp.]|jgi:hypothetical protein|nr:hypothetical protein [Lentimicrobium sp.]
MKPFKNLSEDEYKMLLKFPAYISLLAANHDGKLDEVEKKSAIKFAHIKTFTCNPLLIDFYEEVDKVFERNIVELDLELPKGKENRDKAIKSELLKLENIVIKSGRVYTSTMFESMLSFKDHVSKAHNNVLVDFVFPLSIKGYRI